MKSVFILEAGTWCLFVGPPPPPPPLPTARNEPKTKQALWFVSFLFQISIKNRRANGPGRVRSVA